MGIEGTGHTGKEGSDHEGCDLEARRIDTHCLGGDFVVTHSLKSPPVG